MEYLEIEGGRPLAGQVRIQGSKNAVLPVLSAALLHTGRTILHNCPRIQDVEAMLEILRSLGCGVIREGQTLRIDASGLCSHTISEEQAGKMRSSITLLGSLLGRTGQACIPHPGGCIIGERPIDLHLQGLRQLGVEFLETPGQVNARCAHLRGETVALRFPSVGATENLILAAVRADGETCIRGAAREPEIVELCHFLQAMGARITGEGTSCVRIRGVDMLHDTEYTVMADRIVAGTYLCAAAACGGEAVLKDAPAGQLEGVLSLLEQMGSRICREQEQLIIRAPDRGQAVSGICTAPYPGFPTDLQSPFLAALVRARGESSLTETIFEARFKIAKDLCAMGAKIRIDGNTAFVHGVPRLQGCPVYAQELRGGAALCIAAAAAEGESRIYGCRHIFRGYENVIGDLKNLGIVINYREDTAGEDELRALSEP